jgi:hypothetical protein
MFGQFLPRFVILLTVVAAPFLVIAGQMQAQSTQAPLCADFGGQTSAVVRADIPAGAVNGGSVFCRVLAENNNVLNPSAIGFESVLSLGVINAVEVFGITHTGGFVQQFNAGVKVCLQGTGDIIYMDASQTPRTPTRISYTSENGFTCASVNNGGTVVLVPASNPAPAQPIAPVGVPVTVDPNATPLPPGVAPTATVVPATGGGIVGCRVTTTYAVRLRNAPNVNGEILARIPYDLRLTATAKEGDWYQVIYQNFQGWVSAAYVRPSGTCS